MERVVQRDRADELSQDEHIQEAALGQYNVVLWRQFGAEDPALDNVWLLCRTIGGISLNWPKFCDPSRDELLLQAQATTDEATRIDLYKQIEQKLHDDYLYIFFAHTLWSNAFAENVHGVCDRVSPEDVPLRCVSQRTQLVLVHLDVRVRHRRNPEHHEILAYEAGRSGRAPAGDQHVDVRSDERPR